MSATRRGLAAALSVAGLAAAFPACAQHAAFVDTQHGYGVSAWGLGMRLAPHPGVREWGRWRLDRELLVRVSRFASQGGDGRSLWDFALYPAFRIMAADGGGVAPFAEGGFGAHLVSRTRIGGRELGQAFQFGEYVALGIRFGTARAYSLSLRAEHVSNAHLTLPNDGVSFYGFELQYDWR